MKNAAGRTTRENSMKKSERKWQKNWLRTSSILPNSKLNKSRNRQKRYKKKTKRLDISSRNKKMTSKRRGNLVRLSSRKLNR